MNVAFQMGFCTFVMSNYMKALPHELTEAARVDGASVWKQYWKIILPLCRTPLAALATLEVIWVYNDFFWALPAHHQGRPAADHLGPEQPEGPVLAELQPARGGGPAWRPCRC